MFERVESIVSKLRYLAVGTVIIGSFIALYIIIAVVSSSQAQAEASKAPVESDAVSTSSSSNAVTNSLSTGTATFARLSHSAGHNMHKGLAGAGSSINRYGGLAVNSSAHSIEFASHGIGSGLLFTAKNALTSVTFTGRIVSKTVAFIIGTPIHIAGVMTHATKLDALVTPNTDKAVPVITSESSAELLAHQVALTQQQIEAQQKANDLLAAQLAANHNLGGAVLAGDPTHGGYPAKWADAGQDSQVDNWGMYNRECVSYAAWKVYQTYGDMPNWGGVGNANEWIQDARNSNIPTGSIPRAHSVAISLHGYYGHAMWVEAVNGNMIYVSQYNYDLRGHYSEMWVDGSSFTYLYFK